MSQTITDASADYINEISSEYQFEKPAIDRLLDFIWSEEAKKPAIDKLIQEYLDHIASPYIYQFSTPLATTPIPENQTKIDLVTTPTRTIQHFPSAPSFYQTPMGSVADSNSFFNESSDLDVNHSTPLLRPMSTRSYRSASIDNDRFIGSPAGRNSFSSNQDVPIHDEYRFRNPTHHRDVRLKRAAAQERRQATRHFGQIQPGLVWTAPLPIRARAFSIRPPALSCKIFLGGIPHDINPRDLQERLDHFGSVRLEWPHADHSTIHRSSSSNSLAGFVYAIYDNDDSVRRLLHACSTKTDRAINDGRCEYFLDVFIHRTHGRRKSIQVIPWFVEDSQWLMDEEFRSNSFNSWEDRLGSTECINRTVFVGALHGMMTAFALAKIFQELFGDVEYAAIDTDRNKYPIGSGRVVFVNAHSYYAAVTANYLMIECEKFCKVIQIDPYLSDSVSCAGVGTLSCQNLGQYFCRSLKCMKYYCARCWDLTPHHQERSSNVHSSQEYEPPALVHKPLMRNARAL